MPETVTWLHISDTHFCKEKHGFESEEIFDSFFDDLEKMKIEYNLYPDMVFFTGDIALGQINKSIGLSLKDQYNEAKEFLERIQKIFPNLDVSNIFTVPGNHDINRNRVGEGQTELLKSFQKNNPRDGRKRINELIIDNNVDWKRYLERLKEYKDFLKNCNYKHLLKDPDRLMYSIRSNINNFELGIMGLNSAWSSYGGDEDKSKLWLGTYQISKSYMSLKDTMITIVISHHPPNWFTEFEDLSISREIENKFNFYLHGHEHQEWISVINKHIRIASGALYGGFEQKSGYNFVKLYPYDYRGEVFLRTYNNGTWIPNIIGKKTNNEGIWKLENLNLNIKKKEYIINNNPAIEIIEDNSAVEKHYDCITKTECTQIFTRGSRPDIDPERIFGRENDLKNIEDQLNNKSILVITSFRGTGKSTLASMFVERMSKSGEYACIYWQKVDDTTDISDIIDNFFTAIGKPVKGLSTYKIVDQIALLFKELNEASYILVLDNFEILLDPHTNKPLESKIGFSELIEKANENCIRSKILFTSWESFSSERGIRPFSYQIKGLDVSAGVQLLRREELNESETELKKAIELSGGHPLALILLAQLVRDGADKLSDLLNDNSLWIGKDGEIADKILNKVYKERLSEDESKLLQYVSIFRQPVPAKAIVTIANDPGFFESKVKRIALSLIHKSLLQKDGEYYWEESLISKYITTQIPIISEYHKLACNYYLSLPLPIKPTKKEDVYSLIEAHYHACMAKEYDQAFKIIFDNNLKENLSLWGSSTVLLELYSLMLPENHFGNETLLENKGYHGEILGSLGYAYYSLCESRKAIEYYEPALRIAKEIRDRKLEGLWLGNLGSVYRRLLNEPERAIEYYEQALKIAKELGDRKLEGLWLGNLGIVYEGSNEFRKAIGYLEQALRIARELGDNLEGDWLGVLGQIYKSQGESRKAIEHYEEALKIARETGNKHSEGVWLGNLGLSIYELGEPKRAIEYLEQSNKIAREIGDRNLEEINLENMGHSYRYLGEIRKAIENYEQEIKIAMEIEDRKFEGLGLIHLGKAYNDLGDSIKSIEYLGRALKIAKEVEKKSPEGQFLGKLWEAYRDLGESKKAIEYFEQELEFSREKGEVRSEEILLENLGLAYKDLCEYKKAIDYLEQALKIAQEIENRRKEGLLLYELGNAYSDLRENKKAIKYFEQALIVAKEIGDRSSEGYCLEYLGYTHFILTEHKKAIEYLEQGLSIGKEIEDPEMTSYCERELKKLKGRKSS